MSVRPRNIAWLRLVGPAVVLFLFSGCVGFYGNTKRFLEMPSQGMEELELIKRYGEPSFSAVVEDQKVYTYRVRDVKYIVMVGIYRGYDLIVVCRDGRVVEVEKLPRGHTLTVAQPVPWALDG